MKTFTLAIRITTVVALSLLMVQCGNKQAAPNQSVSDDTTISSYGDKLPIAYINVDSLLSKYNYAKDLNEKMINKQENARASINEKARQLKKEQDDFQRKYQNNAFLSQERFPLSRKSPTRISTIGKKGCRLARICSKIGKRKYAGTTKNVDANERLDQSLYQRI